jgi:hypothetical protein
MSIIAKPSGNVVFSANREGQTEETTDTNDTNFSWKSVSIYNTGTNDLEMEIDNLIFPLSADETFNDDLVDFNQVKVRPKTSGQSIDYRLIIRS